MIEIEYKQENEEEAQQEGYFHIPKNIRQMGDVQHGHKIYIEDYVYTYLMHQVDESLGVGRVAILLGKSHWMNGNSYLFIYSAFLVEKMEVSRETIDFTSSIWGGIYETIRQYFPGQEIVGWFLSVPGFSMDIESAVYRAHLNHFGGSDKTLFAMDSVEKDEAFYLYENGVMVRQKGYYVFYEKNDPMQAFLVAANQERRDMEQEEVEDDAVHSFRRILQGKQETRGKARSQRFVYGLSAVLIAAVLVLGVTYVQNATKLKLLEKTISQMTAGGSDGATETKAVSTGTDTSAETGADESAKTGADASTQTGADASTQTGADASAKTGTDESAKTGADASTQTGADASSKTGTDTSAETGTDESAETGADASAKTGVDTSTQTETDASAKTEGDTSEKTKVETTDDTKPVAGVPKNGQDKAETADGSAAGNTGDKDSTENTDAQNQEDIIKKDEEADVSYRIYEVQQGDTISTVCESHYGTIDRVGEICRLNGLSKYDKIYPGQKILLP